MMINHSSNMTFIEQLLSSKLSALRFERWLILLKIVCHTIAEVGAS